MVRFFCPRLYIQTSLVTHLDKTSFCILHHISEVTTFLELNFSHFVLCLFHYYFFKYSVYNNIFKIANSLPRLSLKTFSFCCCTNCLMYQKIFRINHGAFFGSKNWAYEKWDMGIANYSIKDKTNIYMCGKLFFVVYAVLIVLCRIRVDRRIYYYYL